MSRTHKDWAFQVLGLIVGFVPAILLVFALPIGIAVYAMICIGFVHPRSRSFAYGAVCSLLTLPGLGLALWWSA